MSSTLAKSFQHTKDSKSLWNFTLAPGWTEKEAQLFRLLLIVYGFGKWTDILQSGYLVGKTVAQMSNQAQRLVGQQSVAEFFGLHLDVEDIFKVNENKSGVRKNGCLINVENNPTKAETEKKRQKNKKSYEIEEDIRDNIFIYPLLNSEFSEKALISTEAKLERLEFLQRKKKEVENLIEGKSCKKKRKQKNENLERKSKPERKVRAKKKVKYTEDDYVDPDTEEEF
eukprot:snap_masked-scaffold_50-processed-gene-1.58-mRNA-1 protein AED:0.08 eAED:0.08 QI:0/-1/0/1/-1/1/1/0/226